MNRLLALLVLTVPLLWSCNGESRSLSGTNDETITSLAVIYRLDGKPAAGARVMVYAPGDTQSAPRAQGIVDDEGHVSLPQRLPAGSWNLMVRDAGGTALFQDSLPSDGTKLTILTDTLRRIGKVVGRVRVQPQDKPTIAWVQLLGAGRYANVDDSGRFAFDSVPSGRLTLAALTLQTQYTPTFRAAPLRPDSILDLGTIDMIYTGVPMVTGVKAVWDSASATVTVRWDSVPERGLLGFRVFRGTAIDPDQLYQVAFVTSGCSWTDTLFRGIAYEDRGSLGGRYDSMQTDLYYRVKAVANNEDGPASIADSLSVRSPRLTHVWKPQWSAGSALPAGYTAGVSDLDSLGDGVAMLVAKDSFQTLWTSSDGNSWTQGITLPANVGGVFWKGKFWWTTGHQTGESYDAKVYTDYGYVLAIGRLIDTIHVHSFDGNGVSTSSVPVRGDTVTAGAIVPMGDQIVLAEERLAVSVTYARQYMATQDLHTSADGKAWVATEDRNLIWWYTENQKSHALWLNKDYEMVVLPNRFLFAETRWAAGGDSSVVWESTGTEKPDWPYPGNYGLPFFDKMLQMGTSLFITGGGRLHWAPQRSPKEWHEVTPPGKAVYSALPWRGKLLVSDASTLWSAPIPASF